MKLRAVSTLVLVLALSLLAVSARADTTNIGTASVYAVLGEAGVTNTGPSVIYGDVGGSTGTPAVTGFPPGTVVVPATIVTGSTTNFSDATNAYNTAQGLVGAINLTGDTLGVGVANNLTPGIYSFSSSASINSGGALILDAGGSDSANWVFQIGSTLTTGSASSVEVIDAGSGGPFTGSITWAVGSSATLGTTTSFMGTIISPAGDQLLTGATIECGRVISLDASVTLDTNVIDTPADCTVTAGAGGTGGTIGVTPEPSTFVLYLTGLLSIGLLMLRKLRSRSLTNCAEFF